MFLAPFSLPGGGATELSQPASCPCLASPGVERVVCLQQGQGFPRLELCFHPHWAHPSFFQTPPSRA